MKVRHYSASGQFLGEEGVLWDALQALPDEKIRQGTEELEAVRGRPLEAVER